MKRTRTRPTASFHLILNVDDTTSEFISNLSNKINRGLQSEFVVDNKEYKPHITLYLFSAPVKNIKKLISTIGSIQTLISREKLGIDKIVHSDGWLMVELKDKRKIFEFHRKIVGLINPLREKMLRRKYRTGRSLLKLRQTEKAILLKYGDKHAMENFHPHISLAKYSKQDKAMEVYEKFKKVKLPKTLTIKSLELIRTIGNESGGIGISLFCKDLS